ncbi:disintegrin and metalloproteinase domain-containing protein 26A-like [Meriones unguiculatus]|uniref:disintegrin and metalloproteinase domain-containing protein 26A-like n=1 Tax=Meriones unguiculatus TaxID=10047 RepID=UPI00293E1983|nr:disintegrin and metalloproteinase domain-containing protein 26A-like [Meriones unguiculatus]
MFLQFCLYILLFPSAWSSTGHSKYSSPPEVVIPLRATDTQKHISPDWLSYSLHFGGQRHIIIMKSNKNFISRNFLLFTYSDQGDLLSDQPFVQNDCYYHGYVDKVPESMVIINTCFGNLQGILEINGTIYEIMPKNSTSTFEHLLYKLNREESESFPMRCGLTEEEIARQLKLQESKDTILMQVPYKNWWTHRKHLEYFVVIDNKRYVYKNNNATACLQEILQIVNGINGYYLQIDTDVALRALEIWTVSNHVNVTLAISEVLRDFCNWKRANVDKRTRSDIIHLFARQGYGIYLGLAYVGTVCKIFNCAVNSFMGDSPQSMAYVIAHEMGHNLGMPHDEKQCTCGGGDCIMAPHKTNANKFSNCSYEKMFSTISKINCLYNVPHIVQKLTVTSVCGNNLTEEGEQCDCGSPELCLSNECCSGQCVLTPDAQCDVGLCCENCKFLPTGTMCRQPENECDLPEWCNGTSAACPENVYKEDGSPCKGDGYCYKMACNKRQEQCQSIFGATARSANEICYMAMNTRGDRFGNCGNDSYNYKRCSYDDVLCGRIQCENVQQIPLRRNHETVHWIHFSNITCWSMDFHFGSTLDDSGSVRDGTPCGLNHLCIAKKCVRKSVLLTNCSEALCHMQGICNSKHHCHCDDGWEPPFCLSHGYGGSIDSGPPPMPFFNKSNKSMFILGFVILLSLLLIFLIFLILRNKSRQENHEEYAEFESK